jgi:U3 small nucleolar RNA-associated protein 14
LISGILKNFAEISVDDGIDIDSTPDANNKNTTGENDVNLIDDSVVDGDSDEDDHDVATVTITASMTGQCATGLQATTIYT